MQPELGIRQNSRHAVEAGRLVFALDAIGGFVSTMRREITAVTPLEMIQALEPWCDAFLYTHVDTEGLLGGFPPDVIRPLRAATSRQLIAAGEIRSQGEIDALHNGRRCGGGNGDLSGQLIHA